MKDMTEKIAIEIRKLYQDFIHDDDDMMRTSIELGSTTYKPVGRNFKSFLIRKGKYKKVSQYIKFSEEGNPIVWVTDPEHTDIIPTNYNGVEGGESVFDEMEGMPCT